MTSQPFHGVLVPVLTPVHRAAASPMPGGLSPSAAGCSTRAPGASRCSARQARRTRCPGAERMALLDALIEAGIPPEKLMPGTGACSMSEAASLVRHAVGHGCGGVLMLPPFYYKGVSDDGIFAFVSRGDRQGRLARAQGLSLPYPAGRSGRLFARPRRPLDRGLSGDRRRAEGQLRRLEQHGGAARPFPGFRGIPGLRGLSARRAAQGRRRLHHRLGQCQCPGDPQSL